MWPDVYEGSGPERERFEREAERDSCASRHGNDSAGLVDSGSAPSLKATASCALRGACWCILLVAWFDCCLVWSIDGCADLGVRHGSAEGRAIRVKLSSLRGTLMAANNLKGREANAGRSGEGHAELHDDATRLNY